MNLFWFFYNEYADRQTDRRKDRSVVTGTAGFVEPKLSVDSTVALEPVKTFRWHNNNNSNLICIAPYGRDFRGADFRLQLSSYV